MPVSLLSMLGAALAWVVILAAGTASGFGGAYAWDRWGRGLGLVTKVKGLLGKPEQSPFEQEVQAHLAEKEAEEAEGAAARPDDGPTPGEAPALDAAPGTTTHPVSETAAQPPDDYWAEAWIVHPHDHPGQGLETAPPTPHKEPDAPDDPVLFEAWNEAQEEALRAGPDSDADPAPDAARPRPKIPGLDEHYQDPEEAPIDETRGVRIIRIEGMPGPGAADDASDDHDADGDQDADGDLDADTEGRTDDADDLPDPAAPYWPEGVEREGAHFAHRTMADRDEAEEEPVDLAKIRRVYGAAGAPFGPGGAGPHDDERHPNAVPHAEESHPNAVPHDEADDMPVPARTVHPVQDADPDDSPWMPGTEAHQAPAEPDVSASAADDDLHDGAHAAHPTSDDHGPSGSDEHAVEDSHDPTSEDRDDSADEPSTMTLREAVAPAIAFGLDPSLMRPPRPSEIPQPPTAPRRARPQPTTTQEPHIGEEAAQEALAHEDQEPEAPAEETATDTPDPDDPMPTDPASKATPADTPDLSPAATESEEDELLAAGWEEVEDDDPATTTAPMTPPPSSVPPSSAAASAPPARRHVVRGPLPPQARPPIPPRRAPTPQSTPPAPTEEPPATADHDDVSTSGAYTPPTTPPPAASQVSQISRSEAIEELTAIYELDYEDGVALVNAGLWGFENHDEWARAMRAGSRAAGVDPEVLKNVLNTPMRDIQPRLKKLREKRAWTSLFENLWGVGPEEASALYDAGFEDLDALKEASTDKLGKVPGIGTARAFQIKASLHDLAPDDNPAGDEKKD